MPSRIGSGRCHIFFGLLGDAVREFSEIPIVHVLSACADTLARSASEGIGRGAQFQLATNHVVSAPGHPSDEQLIRTSWPPLADHLNLLEPFDRIREALDEAQRSARQAA